MAEKTQSSAKVEGLLNSVLSDKFVKTEEVAAVLSIAFQGNKNVLIYGPAGHGKSEMVSHITDSIIHNRCAHVCNGACEDKCTHEDEPCSESCMESGTYTMSFGEGMDEAQLWGGVDFHHLEEYGVLRYKPQYSFLDYECAIFEEIFDAPTSVLLALKDTLTAKELRKGAQRYPMKTRCVIGLTNKEPDEISDLGPSAHALVERFPLQLNLKWDRYDDKDYLEMFNVRYPDFPLEIKEQVASICGIAIDKGSLISPRTAVHALEAVMVNSDRKDGMYECLKYVKGFELAMGNIHKDIQEIKIRREAVKKITALDMDFDDHKAVMEKATSLQEITTCIQAFERIDGELEVMALPDDLYDKRNAIRSSIDTAMDTAKEKLFSVASSSVSERIDRGNQEDTNTDMEDIPR